MINHVSSRTQLSLRPFQQVVIFRVILLSPWHFLARTLSFYSLLFHMSRHLRQQRHFKQMRTLFCRRVNAMWRVTMEEATWSILTVESSRGLWPRTLEVFSTEYDLNIAFCLVPTPPARSGAPLGASICTCKWPERGTRSKQANVGAINCSSGGRSENHSQYSYRCLARKGRGSKEMRQIIPRVLWRR